MSLACCESWSKQNEKRHAHNKARERWNNKEEINKGPTTDNGVLASSLEIRTGIFSKSVTLWLLAILQRLPRVTWCAYVRMIFSVMATLSVRQKMPVFVHL